MTYYFIIAIMLFLLGCALLHRYRTNLIVDHRAKARALIIDQRDFWRTVEKFNRYGDFATQHNDWSKWKFSDFYPGYLQGGFYGTH